MSNILSMKVYPLRFRKISMLSRVGFFPSSFLSSTFVIKEPLQRVSCHLVRFACAAFKSVIACLDLMWHANLLKSRPHSWQMPGACRSVILKIQSAENPVSNAYNCYMLIMLNICQNKARIKILALFQHMQGPEHPIPFLFWKVYP